MANKIKFKINKDNFSTFLDKLNDISNIDDTVKLKIDNDHILMYSTLGGNVMLAFKNYLLKREDFFIADQELDSSYDIIIANCKKFSKNLDFLKSSDKITIEITYKESPDDDNMMLARTIQVVGGKLKVNWLAGEKYEMRDIDKGILKQRLDIKNRKWYFILTKEQFTDIKKLSSINSDKIINFSVDGGKVVVSETAAWELEIDEIEKRSANFIFNKRFLSCINSEKEMIEFSMFDTFILIKDEDTNLMLSYEQDFSDDDI
jgi:hypothetical protein